MEEKDPYNDIKNLDNAFDDIDDQEDILQLTNQIQD